MIVCGDDLQAGSGSKDGSGAAQPVRGAADL
jgi:hypothetical protein